MARVFRIVLQDSPWVSPDPNGRFYRRRHAQARIKHLDGHPTGVSFPTFAVVPETSPIEELLSAITKQVPDEEWESIPTDLSKNIDHYLYGSKKVSE